jgi:aspartyl protease family protein
VEVIVVGMASFTRSIVTVVLAFVAFFWVVVQPEHSGSRGRSATSSDPLMSSSVPGSDGSAAPGSAQASGGQVVLTRSSNGHFYTDAQVNGRTIHFLVDTGATTVALSRSDAEAVGLATNDPSAFTGTGRGANGTLTYMPVTLDSVGIGNLEERDVDGVVLNGDVDVSLLGQSWLKRIRSVSIADDRMTLE